MFCVSIGKLDLDQKDMAFCRDYAKISKEMKEVKKEYRAILSKINSQQLKKSKKEQAKDFILKTNCQ